MSTDSCHEQRKTWKWTFDGSVMCEPQVQRGISGESVYEVKSTESGDTDGVRSLPRHPQVPQPRCGILHVDYERFLDPQELIQSIRFCQSYSCQRQLAKMSLTSRNSCWADFQNISCWEELFVQCSAINSYQSNTSEPFPCLSPDIQLHTKKSRPRGFPVPQQHGQTWIWRFSISHRKPKIGPDGPSGSFKTLFASVGIARSGKKNLKSCGEKKCFSFSLSPLRGEIRGLRRTIWVDQLHSWFGSWYGNGDFL